MADARISGAVLSTTKSYESWEQKLRDRSGRSRIKRYFERFLESGQLGSNAKAIGGGVTEIRFNFGQGYRVYVAQKPEMGLVLLCGGDKSSTSGQNSDVRLARSLAAAI